VHGVVSRRPRACELAHRPRRRRRADHKRIRLARTGRAGSGVGDRQRDPVGLADRARVGGCVVRHGRRCIDAARRERRQHVRRVERTEVRLDDAADGVTAEPRHGDVNGVGLAVGNDAVGTVFRRRDRAHRRLGRRCGRRADTVHHRVGCGARRRCRRRAVARRRCRHVHDNCHGRVVHVRVVVDVRVRDADDVAVVVMTVLREPLAALLRGRDGRGGRDVGADAVHHRDPCRERCEQRNTSRRDARRDGRDSRRRGRVLAVYEAVDVIVAGLHHVIDADAVGHVAGPLARRRLVDAELDVLASLRADPQRPLLAGRGSTDRVRLCAVDVHVDRCLSADDRLRHLVQEPLLGHGEADRLRRGLLRLRGLAGARPRRRLVWYAGRFAVAAAHKDCDETTVFSVPDPGRVAGRSPDRERSEVDGLAVDGDRDVAGRVRAVIPPGRRQPLRGTDAPEMHHRGHLDSDAHARPDGCDVTVPARVDPAVSVVHQQVVRRHAAADHVVATGTLEGAGLRCRERGCSEDRCDDRQEGDRQDGPLHGASHVDCRIGLGRCHRNGGRLLFHCHLPVYTKLQAGSPGRGISPA
jgi:hypothetical protein